LWKVAIAFALTLALLYFEDQYFNIDGLLMLAVSGISAEVVFLGLMILMRELKVKYLLSIWTKLRDDSD
jgi:hypothetical protein